MTYQSQSCSQINYLLFKARGMVRIRSLRGIRSLRAIMWAVQQQRPISLGVGLPPEVHPTLVDDDVGCTKPGHQWSETSIKVNARPPWQISICDTERLYTNASLSTAVFSLYCSSHRKMRCADFSALQRSWNFGCSRNINICERLL